MEIWKRWKYKNLTFFFLSLLFAFILSQSKSFHSFLLNLGDFGYAGAFFGGMLFVSSFTVATGALILLTFAEEISPIEIAIIAGLGALAGDFTIFRFIKDGLLKEITPVYKRLGGIQINQFLKRKHFRWILPIAGALIIASPFPDEIGVSLMGISKMKTSRFLLLSFILNSLGIFLLISLL